MKRYNVGMLELTPFFWNVRTDPVFRFFFAHPTRLLGELYVDADKVVNVSQIETYHPVLWGGAKVRLHYARAKDYLNLTAIRGEVVVQFWLRPGDRAVELSFAGGEKASTPRVLEGMF